MSTENQEESPIYQAQSEEYEESLDEIPQILHLNLRGTHVNLDKETLINLPESLLIVMFPTGLATAENQDEDDNLVVLVDFDPRCLDFVLSYYRNALEKDRHAPEDSLYKDSDESEHNPSILVNIPIIILREELEYYCISSDKKSNLAKIKLAAGEHLRAENSIFTALQKNINDTNNAAEQHLIDLLCEAGFDEHGHWDYRELESNKTCVNSMSLITLKTSGLGSHRTSMRYVARKFIPFWRKPAY